jgi:hypothetical protein
MGLAEKYMFFKGSNPLVQIYRSLSITGNYGRRSFSKYGISDVNIHSRRDFFRSLTELLKPAFINNKT